MDVAQLGLSVDSRPVVQATDDLREFGDQAEQVEDQATAAMESISASMSAMIAPIAGIAGGAFTLDSLFNSSQLIAETDTLAQALGVSTGTLQQWQYAAEEMGLSAEQMGAIIKDSAEKIGEFSANGGGEAADIFKELNIDIAELQNLSPDKQLLKIGKAISDIEDRNQRISYMEMLAGDATLLLPLLEDNAAELLNLAQEASSLGIAMTDDDIRRARELDQAMSSLSSTAQGLSNELAAQFGPAIATGIDALTEFVSEGGDARGALDMLAIAGGSLAAMYGGRLVASMAASTAEKVANFNATTAQIRGEQAAAAQAMHSANVALAQAQAERQQAVNRVANAQAVRAQTGSTVLLTQARTALGVATQALHAKEVALTAATQRYTAAAGAAGVASRGMTAVLGLVGGPGGAALLATGAMIAYAASIDETEVRAQKAIGVIDQLALSMRETWELLSGSQEENRIKRLADDFADLPLDEIERRIARTAERINEFNAVQSKGFWGDAVNGEFDTAQREVKGLTSDLRALSLAHEMATDAAKKQAEAEARAAQEKQDFAAQYDGVLKANNDYYKSVNRIMALQATEAEKQEMITKANERRVKSIKAVEEAERKAAAEALYSVSVYQSLAGQYNQMQAIENEHLKALKAIHSAEMDQLQRKELLYQADQKRIRALQDLKAQEVAVLETRMQGGEDTGAVNMDYITRSGESSNLKSSQVFEMAARNLADTIKSGLSGPESIAGQLAGLQRMASRYGALGEGFDAAGMRNAIDNLAAMAADQLRQGTDKPMTADEYAAVLKNAQEEGDRLKAKEEGAYDAIVEIERKMQAFLGGSSAVETDALRSDIEKSITGTGDAESKKVFADYLLQQEMSKGAKKDLGEITINVSDGKGGTSYATMSGSFDEVSAMARVLGKAAAIAGR